MYAIFVVTGSIQGLYIFENSTVMQCGHDITRRRIGRIHSGLTLEKIQKALPSKKGNFILRPNLLTDEPQVVILQGERVDEKEAETCFVKDRLSEKQESTEHKQEYFEKQQNGQMWLRLLDVVACVRTKEDMACNGLTPLAMGFANRVCRTTLHDGRSVVVKSYTDLALVRVDAEAIGAVDKAACGNGLCIGPRVYHSSVRGLITEYVEGRTLQEEDFHQGDFGLLSNVARALATLHQLPVPDVCQGEPMLWRTIDKMIHKAASRPDLMPRGFPSLKALSAEVAVAKAALQRHECEVVLGHGDFKPTNIIADAEDRITIIDFEVAGLNYRGFDLLKIFRTAGMFSEPHFRHFLGVYAARTACLPTGGDVGPLLSEARLFEPLTWLEAAVFFLVIPQYKPEETPRWHSLAVDRWEKYEQSRCRLMDSCSAIAAL
eukprot:TRINITY_DN50746_c0_g1_i1.p1 TRINITY_DN50746_c0_g1~~TRINITY_DN50746_c0_g1_i1.p1  ORF type:complete len:433 (+),score=61.13 TRINITY_DN50746_c0_g1_i1:95-1393(+)